MLKNKMRALSQFVRNAGIEGTDITFEKITQPTPLQQKAIELLNVSLVCTQ
ncbi:MAG: hypothetical protein F6K16_26740 [Symploca sp. SIO2B6]|nr:hypothetical protein [Symploca sp. SIO2B6]